jgi:hypothetical protein
MKTTEIVAWVGATTGVASFLWNIYTKLTSGPRLRVTAFANMILMPPPQGNQNFLKITVQNIGTATTTLTNLELLTFVPRWERFLSRVKLKKRSADEKHAVVIQYRGPQFPHKLEVGSEWQALMQQDEDFQRWFKTDELWCAVWHSFSKQPVPTKILGRLL